MKRVFKAGCTVGACMHVTDEMSIDLAHIDRRAHEPTGDYGLLGCLESDIGGQLEVPGLRAVGMIIVQTEPPI
jgi:hypothetical protein